MSLSESSLLRVLYEDEHCFVLDKPSGLHTVSLPRDEKDTLAARLLQVDRSLAEAAEKELDAGLVQRLDFETSGTVIGAKSRQAWNALHEDLAHGSIEKSYVILTEGALQRETAVNNYLGSPNRRAKKIKVFEEKPRDKDRALPAQSRFVPMQEFAALQASLARVFAPTARRHQVRAHAAFLGIPLLGDSLYGSQRSTRSLEEILGTAAPAFLLHAETISFPHPITRKVIALTAPPTEFLAALYRLGNISAGAAFSKTS